MKKQLIGFCFAFALFSVNVLAQETKIGRDIPLSEEFQSKLCRLHEIEAENIPRMQGINMPVATQELSPTLQIDSIIWKSKDSYPVKEEYLFDSSGNLTSKWSFYRINNKWISTAKEEYAYDIDNKTLSTVLYHRNEDAKTWDYVEKHDYTNDHNNHVILNTTSVWDKPSNMWIVKFRYESIYDNNGSEISNILYKWAENTKDLILSSKAEYVYNNQGLNSAKIAYEWNRNSNLWERVGKYAYIYDDRGNQASVILSIGETDETSIGISKDVRNFDSDNNNISNTRYSWNTEAKEWMEIYKNEFIYDNNNLLARQTDYLWNKSAKLWIQNWEDEYVFDVNGNRISRITKWWNELTNTWSNDSKTDYTYDNEYAISNLYPTALIYSSLFELFKKSNVPVEATEYNWDYENQQWESSYSSYERRYYSPLSLSNVPEITENELSIYPNPVVDMLQVCNIQGELDVKLYDLQGVLLLQTNQNKLDFSSYKAGVYLLNVNGQIKKLIKK